MNITDDEPLEDEFLGYAPFNAGQKALLMCSTLACILVSIGIYKIAKRPINDGENYFERMEWLYALVAGSLLGKFICSALPHATLHSELGGTGYTSYGVVAFAVCLGICFFMILSRNLRAIQTS